MRSSHAYGRSAPPPGAITLSDIRFQEARPEDADGGLLGWISLTLNGHVRVDGLALRRTASGEVRLTFPSRRDTWGREHYIVRPLDEPTRLEIQAQVFRALNI